MSVDILYIGWSGDLFPGHFVYMPNYFVLVTLPLASWRREEMSKIIIDSLIYPEKYNPYGPADSEILSFRQKKSHSNLY